VRAGVGWGLVFGFYVATQALTTPRLTRPRPRGTSWSRSSETTRDQCAGGTAIRIDTVPGFTSWKCLTVLAIMGAVWGILTSTKLTRGEEDAGRWELLLAGESPAEAPPNKRWWA